MTTKDAAPDAVAASYQVLSYRIRVRSDDPDIGAYVDRVLAGFRVDDTEAASWSTVYDYWLEDHHPEEPRYRLHLDGSWLLGSGDPSHVLDHLFWHINGQTFDLTDDLVLIHAGVVATPDGRALVFPAASGAGKTTLVAGLVRAGFQYLSDEAAAIDPASGHVLPFPKALTVKTGSAEVLEALKPEEKELVGSQWHVPGEQVRSGSRGVPCPVGFVVAYRYEPGAETMLEPLSRAEACVSLAHNALNLPHHGSSVLAVLQRVVENAAGYRLVSGRLEDAVAALAKLSGSRDESIS